MRPLFRHQTPALILGLTLAGAAAIAGDVPASQAQTQQTTPEAPVRCEISLESIAGGTRLSGQVTSDTDIQGTYTMAITSRSSGGTASIRQSGEFEARANQPATLGETRLMGSPARQSVELEVQVNGQRLRCDQAAL